jgi:RNA polymerase sigma-70 factor (ECF subfamily)
MKRDTQNVGQLVDHLFRHQYGKMVAVLSSKFGFRNLQIAEDLVSETLIAAYQTWPYRGIPDVPEAWLMQVAKNKALNLIKHEKRKGQAHRRILDELPAAGEENGAAFFDQEIQDSQLRMIFACCHPSIPPADQLALILKVLCGFGVQEVARALLIGKDAAEKRLARAKGAIRENAIELEAPGGQALKERGPRVLQALYLLFNEGYSSTSGDTPILRDLCTEAMRLLQIHLLAFPESRDAQALMALMYFHVARFDARMDHDGAVIILENQDRSLWDQAQIRLGLKHLMASAQGEEISTYHLEASIAAQHCMAEDIEKTNWPFIATLYQRLFSLTQNPIHQLNLAIVKSRMDGVRDAIADLEELKKERKLKRYPLLFATLGELYRRVGETGRAAEHFNLALKHASSQSERDFFSGKIESLALGQDSESTQ